MDLTEEHVQSFQARHTALKDFPLELSPELSKSKPQRRSAASIIRNALSPATQFAKKKFESASPAATTASPPATPASPPTTETPEPNVSPLVKTTSLSGKRKASSAVSIFDNPFCTFLTSFIEFKKIETYFVDILFCVLLDRFGSTELFIYGTTIHTSRPLEKNRCCVLYIESDWQGRTLALKKVIGSVRFCRTLLKLKFLLQIESEPFLHYSF
jgi:hypothetical protein